MSEAIDRFTASQAIQFGGITHLVLDYWVRNSFIVTAQQKGLMLENGRFGLVRRRRKTEASGGKGGSQMLLVDQAHPYVLSNLSG
jgi:hypothetical protein